MGQMGTVISKVVMLVVLGSGSAVVLCDGQFSRRPIAEMKAWDNDCQLQNHGWGIWESWKGLPSPCHSECRLSAVLQRSPGTLGMDYKANKVGGKE